LVAPIAPFIVGDIVRTTLSRPFGSPRFVG
jgi:hypothetical protein